ncbi:MAG TPA: hypothetical protein VNY51_13470 [Candidatus Dormibacteraeota bacterium]|nr:hypothetical protein [Candidatus Dormibacteraeota bacterium]
MAKTIGGACSSPDGLSKIIAVRSANGFGFSVQGDMAVVAHQVVFVSRQVWPFFS